MFLLGDKFCTFLDVIDSQPVVVKAQDFRVGSREPVYCFREYLGYRLATRLGLTLPPTYLLHHPHYGRISAQDYISTATPLSETEQRTLATTELGFRILLLDVLCGNHDRRLDNLLVANNTVMPIDFNVAFGFKRPISQFYEETYTLVMYWFGIQGVLALQPCDRAKLLKEIQRLEQLLSDQYLQNCLTYIEPSFLPPEERTQLFAKLTERRQLLRDTFEHWWETTLAPLHKLLFIPLGEPS